MKATSVKTKFAPTYFLGWGGEGKTSEKGRKRRKKLLPSSPEIAVLVAFFRAVLQLPYLSLSIRRKGLLLIVLWKILWHKQLTAVFKGTQLKGSTAQGQINGVSIKPITTDQKSSISKQLRIPCTARENARVQVAIGFSFHWLKKWREVCWPMTERGNAKKKSRKERTGNSVSVGNSCQTSIWLIQCSNTKMLVLI